GVVGRVARDELLHRRLRDRNGHPRVPRLGRAHAAELTADFADQHEVSALGTAVVGIRRLLQFQLWFRLQLWLDFWLEHAFALDGDLRGVFARTAVEDERHDRPESDPGRNAVEHEVAEQRAETDLLINGE